MTGQCRNGETHWYDLTPYRKVPYSSCEGGDRKDRGTAHLCPGVQGHSGFFWLMMFFIPVSFAGLMGCWWHRRGGSSRGYVGAAVIYIFGQADILVFGRAIRLPGGETSSRYRGDSGVLSTLASVPWFLIGLGGIAYEWIAEKVESAYIQLRGRRGYGYRNLPVDEDAQILRFEDEE